MEQKVISTYGNRLRVRASGICWKDGQLLLVNHAGLGQPSFWAPPGGEVLFGQTASQTVEREFLEETGLSVCSTRYMFAGEFIEPPLHAVELFFEVRYKSGSLITGSDPETENQLIKEVRFLPWDEIAAIPLTQKHGLFRFCRFADELKNLTGFYRF